MLPAGAVVLVLELLVGPAEFGTALLAAVETGVAALVVGGDT